jgi:hypothetical protein
MHDCNWIYAWPDFENGFADSSEVNAARTGAIARCWFRQRAATSRNKCLCLTKVCSIRLRFGERRQRSPQTTPREVNAQMPDVSAVSEGVLESGGKISVQSFAQNKSLPDLSLSRPDKKGVSRCAATSQRCRLWTSCFGKTRTAPISRYGIFDLMAFGPFAPIGRLNVDVLSI